MCALAGRAVSRALSEIKEAAEHLSAWQLPGALCTQSLQHEVRTSLQMLPAEDGHRKLLVQTQAYQLLGCVRYAMRALQKVAEGHGMLLRSLFVKQQEARTRREHHIDLCLQRETSSSRGGAYYCLLLTAYSYPAHCFLLYYATSSFACRESLEGEECVCASRRRTNL